MKSEPFSVRNENWQILETQPNVFALISMPSGKQRLDGLKAKELASMLAVVSELDRYLRSKGK